MPAFTLKNQTLQANSNSEPTNPEISSNETQNSGTLGFLNPRKDVNKDIPNDPYSVELAEKGSYHYTLKTLNALNIVSYILCALMQKPGVDAPNEEISDSFRHLIQQTSSAAITFCEKMGVDPTKEKNFWIRNVLEKRFAEVLHDQWISTGTTNIESLTKLLDQVLEMTPTTSEMTYYDEFSDPLTVKLAVFKSMVPIITEAKTNFDLYRNLEEDIEPIMKKLFDVSSNGVEKLADDYADSGMRGKLFSILIQEAGALYTASWKAETKNIKEIMSQSPPEKINKHIENYKAKGGLPLNRIDHDFEKYFNKMITITERLVKSQKGTIEKRLKNK